MKAFAIILPLTLIMLSLFLAVQPTVYANYEPECFGCPHVIQILPVGSTETGDPLVTTSPADLTIFHTGLGPITNVWLLIVLNTQTYDALNQITINDAIFLTKDDFKLVTTEKIPSAFPDGTTEYPGSLCRYSVSAIKDKMDEKGNDLYYGQKFFLDEITKNPTDFTLKIELDSSVPNMKALILALGKYNYFLGSIEPECCSYNSFNIYSSFSKSTLIVPEAATIIMATAPFGALGLLYKIKRKRK